MDYLCNAFFFYKVNRYDLKDKYCLKTLNQYYPCDHSMMISKLDHGKLDCDRLYKNIVYIELLRRGYSVYIGKLYQKEIDFVAENQDERIYIQVCSTIENNKIIQQKEDTLLAAKDAYPKMIIARTHHPRITHDGIEIVDIADWLIKQ